MTKTALVTLGKPGAGKGSVIPNFLQTHFNGSSVSISSGDAMSKLPEAKPFYLAQKDVPPKIYYPRMREYLRSRILPAHALVSFDGVFRKRQDVVELMDEKFAEQFTEKFVIELLHDNHDDLVERMRGRNRLDFSPDGARKRIDEYVNRHDEVLLALKKRGFQYRFVDATQLIDGVQADFYKMFITLRGGYSKVVNA